jgi:hypothetical protein
MPPPRCRRLLPKVGLLPTTTSKPFTIPRKVESEILTTFLSISPERLPVSSLASEDAGEKDIIVPFAAVKTMKKNDKWWLTLDETKDDLKNASGFKYDKASTTWVPEKK